MKYKINKGFIIQKMDDNTIIFDSKKSILFTLNDTASYIFQKIKKGHSMSEIHNMIVKKYNIKENIAKKDLSKLLFDLNKKKILSPTITKRVKK